MGKPSLSADPLIGQVVGGRYEVVRLIGKGGMGAIYEIRNTRLGRAFALKVLLAQASADREVIQRFRREADVIARIKHPNIVEVIDWEELEDGSPCMVLEYLRGEDLSSRVREAAPMPWPFIARIGDQILAALTTAHAAGVVHRDLKPQNVFLAIDDSGEEKAKLLDFGVSKIRDSRSLVTTDARLLGTPSYMSPEQAEGRNDDIGARTDVWAMGAILYEMAIGELAFGGASMPAVLYKICSRDAAAVNSKRDDAPPEFVQVVREALSRDLAQRIPDANTMRLRLRDALREVSGISWSEQLPVVRPTPMPTPTRIKRHTGATDETIQSGNLAPVTPLMLQPTVASVSSPPPTGGLISASTLPPVKRAGPLVGVIGTVAVALVVVVVVLATRGKAGKDAAPPPPPPAAKVAAPVVVTPPADAAVAIEPPAAPADAALAVATKPPIKRPPIKVKADPPTQDPAKQDPPRQDPPKQDPKKKCDPGDKLCLYGTDQ